MNSKKRGKQKPARANAVKGRARADVPCKSETYDGRVACEGGQMGYSYTWRSKWLTAEAETIGEMAEALEDAAAELRRMEKAGVVLDGGAEDDYAELWTDDPAVAKEFGFEEIEGDEDEDAA